MINTPFNPCEEKIYISVDYKYFSFLKFPLSFWYGIAKSAGASVLSSSETSYSKSLLLSTSSLLVFETSVLLLTCSSCGVGEALGMILQNLNEESLQVITIEDRHYPQALPTRIKRSIEQLPLTLFENNPYHIIEDQAAYTLKWQKSSLLPDPTSCLLLFSPKLSLKDYLNTLSENLLSKNADIIEHFFPNGGYSCNITWRPDQFLTMHYSPEQYLSIDLRASKELYNSLRENIR